MEHNIYPHEPGTLYGCWACENHCFCTPGMGCVYCAEWLEDVYYDPCD